MKTFIGHRRATNQQRRNPWRNAAIVLGLLGLGMCAGAVMPPSGIAWGQVKTAAPAEHFMSGSQLSVPVLKEIAATLHQMDGRLERLEAAARQLQSPRASQSTKN